MAEKNRNTLKEDQAALLNRTPPYDQNPLVQTEEDLQVRNDVLDSVAIRVPDVFSIVNPGSNFTINFDSGQVVNIDTRASSSSSFNVSFANLRENEFGKVNITKKSNDVFNFSNGNNINRGVQENKSTLHLYVFNSGSVYTVISHVDGGNITYVTSAGVMSSRKHETVFLEIGPLIYGQSKQIISPPFVLNANLRSWECFIRQDGSSRGVENGSLDKVVSIPFGFRTEDEDSNKDNIRVQNIDAYWRCFHLNTGNEIASFNVSSNQDALTAGVFVYQDNSINRGFIKVEYDPF